jgi:hypothetical protein
MNVQEQTEVILARLRQAMATQTPVMGRILNAVNRGYSVGVAGLVCFLPITQCLFQVRTVKLLLTFGRYGTLGRGWLSTLVLAWRADGSQGGCAAAIPGEEHPG